MGRYAVLRGWWGSLVLWISGGIISDGAECLLNGVVGFGVWVSAYGLRPEPSYATRIQSQLLSLGGLLAPCRSD